MHVLILRPYRKDNIYFRTIEEREKIKIYNYILVRWLYAYMSPIHVEIPNISDNVFYTAKHMAELLHIMLICF